MEEFDAPSPAPENCFTGLMGTAVVGVGPAVETPPFFRVGEIEVPISRLQPSERGVQGELLDAVVVPPLKRKTPTTTGASGTGVASDVVVPKVAKRVRI